MKPNSDNPARNAARRNSASDCDVFLRTPISGIAVRCANAKNGHPPAEPAISLTKSRRFISAPDRRHRTGLAYWHEGKCPLWVKSELLHCTRECPLWANSGHSAISVDHYIGASE